MQRGRTRRLGSAPQGNQKTLRLQHESTRFRNEETPFEFVSRRLDLEKGHFAFLRKQRVFVVR
jgi:hypothetical protein